MKRFEIPAMLTVMMTMAMLASPSVFATPSATNVFSSPSQVCAVQNLHATVETDGVKIAWSVANTSGIAAFELERAYIRNGSAATAQWESIKMFSLESANAEALDFEYYDMNGATGSPIVLYRIKQITNSESNIYSSAATVQLIGTTDFQIASIYPNPSRSGAQSAVQYRVAEPSFVTVAVYDITGKRIAQLADGYHSRGEYNVALSTSDLTAGTYFVRMVSGGTATSSRLIVSR